ncbi:MAG: hypothetical protein M3237_05155 [Actinomycetota bacterium]|nr:hypothetical protein [Actinomycetota bacterium]
MIPIVLTTAALGTFVPVASADTPANPNCFGVVSSQRAVAHHDIGEHASSQAEPRLGLGNVTRAILGEEAHISDFGTFLGIIDGDDATSCG